MITTNTVDRLEVAAARELRALMHGRVVLPDEESYAQVRKIWNGAVDHEPTLFALCQTAADVQAAVRVGRSHDIPLSVRGGGHDWAGRALRQGGFVIDLSG